MEQAVKLEDFHPDEFTRFEDSGYIVITFFFGQRQYGAGRRGQRDFQSMYGTYCKGWGNNVAGAFKIRAVYQQRILRKESKKTE